MSRLRPGAPCHPCPLDPSEALGFLNLSVAGPERDKDREEELRVPCIDGADTCVLPWPARSILYFIRIPRGIMLAFCNLNHVQASQVAELI
jgi:hypothetical protein